MTAEKKARLAMCAAVGASTAIGSTICRECTAGLGTMPALALGLVGSVSAALISYAIIYTLFKAYVPAMNRTAGNQPKQHDAP